jgi:hypothetical protein
VVLGLSRGHERREGRRGGSWCRAASAFQRAGPGGGHSYGDARQPPSADAIRVLHRTRRDRVPGRRHPHAPSLLVPLTFQASRHHQQLIHTTTPPRPPLSRHPLVCEGYVVCRGHRPVTQLREFKQRSTPWQQCTRGFDRRRQGWGERESRRREDQTRACRWMVAGPINVPGPRPASRPGSVPDRSPGLLASCRPPPPLPRCPAARPSLLG